MSSSRQSPRTTSPVLDLAIAADVDALKSVTARGLPDLLQTAAWLGAAGEMGPVRRAFPLRWPALAAAAAAVVLLTALPVSYVRTTHHEVAWTLSGRAATPVAMESIVAELSRTVGSKVECTAGPRPGTFRLTARIPAGHANRVRSASAAMAQHWSASGISATTRWTPIVERCSGSVLAMAIDRVLELRLRLGGRTPEDIENDLRHQLESGGVPDASVRVDRSSGQTQVQVHATRAPEGAPIRDVRVSVDGRDSASTPVLRYSPDPRKPDAEIAAGLERLLHDRGFEAHVVVRDGHVISIEPRRRAR